MESMIISSLSSYAVIAMLSAFLLVLLVRKIASRGNKRDIYLELN